ncbi:MAG: hypothetical protein XD92_1647 [Proteiniphilum acetatigenes]|uniref:Uncharacterized protein n=1 Tax=Proteiniphilum acetatigenes TaxID=294710 RepID=A0A101HCN9_9BACT|nr:MAG: hypothetical protein XD92_1647 [Proteiniphilum acetatigenes]HCC85450.1 hypothetical protein [Porphyromonadaceae bacterium]
MVTEKSTKAEILKAYEALLKKVQEEKSNIPKQVQEEKKKKEIVDKVTEVSHDGITQGIAHLKSSLATSLDELEAQLSSEFKKLEEIRAAIAVEKQYLEDLYSLSANTDSLAAMLLVQKEKKEDFETSMKEKEEAFNREMNEKKALWEEAKARQKAEEKEYLDDLTKRRKREEDEYQYNLKITRQKEKDDYEAKKAQLEKELIDRKNAFEQEISQREQAVKMAEAELNDLRKQAAGFPGELEKALKAKEQEVTNVLKNKYEFEIKLSGKQNEAEIRLRDQMIESLQQKIQEMQTQLKEYGDKANRAEEGVKDIAMKAIESAAKMKPFAERPEPVSSKE